MIREFYRSVLIGVSDRRLAWAFVATGCFGITVYALTGLLAAFNVLR